MAEQSRSTEITGALSVQSAHINRSIVAIDDRLRPADWATASKVVAQLFALPSGGGVDDDVVIAAYRIALDREPLESIKAAVIEFISGRCGNGFRPSPPELGKAVRRHSDALRMAKHRLEARGAAVEAAIARPVRNTTVVPDGYRVVAVNGSEIVSHDDFVGLVRRKAIPSGGQWTRGRVLLPVGVDLLEPVDMPDLSGSMSFPDSDEWARMHSAAVGGGEDV